MSGIDERSAGESSATENLSRLPPNQQLADTLPWMRSIFSELSEAHGFRRVEPHDYERFRELHGHALLRELGLPLWKLPRVASSLRTRTAEFSGEFSLFPGISDVLHRLAAGGVQLAIVSSNSRENVERILGVDNTRLVAHFGCGVSLFGKALKLRQALRQRNHFISATRLAFGVSSTK